MATPIGNTWYQQAFYQETPDGFWRLHDRGGYLNTLLFDGPVAYWRMDEPSGALVDLIHANNGTVAGGVTRLRPGALLDGTFALGLNGTTGKVTVADNAFLHVGDTFSIELWAKRSAIGTAVTLFDGGTNSASLQFATDNKVRLVKSGGAEIAKSTNAITDKTTFHHIVWTKTGATNRIYVDGVAVTGTVVNQTIASCVGLSIGCSSASTNFFPGDLDEVAYYNKVLTAAQVSAHYALRTAGVAGVADATLNALIGTVHGGVSAGLSGWSGDLDTAMAFDGTSGYLDVGNASDVAYNGRFSVVAAFKTAGNGAVMMMVSKALSVGPKGWGFAIDATGKPRFYAYTSAGVAVFDITSSTAYQDSAWHLAIGVYDPVVTKLATLYVDGVSKASATPSATPDVNAARVLIGAVDNAGVATQFFSGSLDEIAVYPYALRSSQVTALTNARNTVANAKALMQSRSGILRSGAGRSGYYNARTIVLLNGEDVTDHLAKGTLQITEQPNEQPDAARCTLFDTDGSLMPSFGQTFIVSDGSDDNRVFGGTAVKVTRRSVKNPNGTAVNVSYYDFDISDWTWLLNRRTITKSYAAGTLGHVVFQDIIATATSGFTANHVQTDAPALTAPLVFKNTKVASALSALCQATSPNRSWYVDANCDLHYFLTESSQRPKALAPGNSTYDKLNYTLDITQIRTRMVVEGGGASTTAPVSIGATSVAVDECGKYSASGGTVVAPEGILITYTGISAASGPGSLTGIPPSGVGSVTVPLLQGGQLNVWVVVDDVAAQTALGLLELDQDGNPTDGIHEQPLSVPDGTIAQCQQAANAELAAYRNAVVTGTVWSRDKLMKIGKTLSIALPSRGISVDVTIVQLTRSLMTVNTWQFDVTFATVWRNLVDVLKRVKKAA